jgi:hypothetical protein
MSDSRSYKPGSAPPSGAPAPTRPNAPPAGGAPPSGAPAPTRPKAPTGKAPATPERPNAVWNWIKAASKTALDSTSILLKKLEAPDLKMENPEDEEHRGLPDSKDKGGGYDPYNQPIKPRAPGKPPRKS